MSDSALRLGLFGCGMAACLHAAGAREAKNVRISCVCDADPVRATAFASKWGLDVKNSFDDMLADGDVDAVVVCVPSGLHARFAERALAAGKHVLIEKPVATTLEDAARIVELSRLTGLTVGVVAQLRGFADVKKLKKAIDEKRFGRLTLMQLEMRYYRDAAYYASSPWRGTLALDGGAALINQGIHGMDLIAWLFGEPLSVDARVGTLAHDIEGEDTAAALLGYPDGSSCLVSAATSVYPGSPRVLTVCGSEGTAVLTESELTKWDVLGAGDEKASLSTGDYASFNKPDAIPVEAHAGVLSDFAEAVATGRSPMSDAVDGYNALALIRAVYDAAAKGERVRPSFMRRA